MCQQCGGWCVSSARWCVCIGYFKISIPALFVSSYPFGGDKSATPGLRVSLLGTHQDIRTTVLGVLIVGAEATVRDLFCGADQSSALYLQIAPTIKTPDTLYVAEDPIFSARKSKYSFPASHWSG